MKFDYQSVELERYLAGELSDEEKTILEKRMSQDPQLKAQLDELQELRNQVKKNFPLTSLKYKQWERAQENTNSRILSKWLKILVTPRVTAFASLCLVGLLILTVGIPHNTTPQIDLVQNQGRERIKGNQVQLNIYKKTELGSELQMDSSFVQEGDQLQIEYIALDKGFGTIVSLDGNNTLTIHLNGEGNNPATITKEKELLNFSYQLDNAPEFERFYFFNSKNSFSTDSVFQAIKESRVEDYLNNNTQIEMKQLTLRKK